MDKAWLEQQIRECESALPEIEKILREKLHLDDKEFEKIMDCLESKSPYYTTAMHELDMALIMKYVDDSMETYMKYKELSKSSGIEELFNKYTKKNWIDSYLDGGPMEFDGDIIITDPCYIMKEDDDWATCAYGEDMEALGITHYMTRDTLYGDWSCTTFDTDTKEAIGEFCADAGLVSVFLLDEVLKYNPEFDYHLKNKWMVTWIKDFKGTVEFVVKHVEGYYEEDTDYWKKGDYWEDYVLEVVGHGINKVTGKPINFVGKQTGL